jgi:twitching motility protein PilT
MEIALTAAETGHVVYSTLHTISAGQSINRILGMFSKEEEDQVRDRLASTLRYVVSQRLAPKVGGGRVMVPEIMGNNMRSREVMLLGENEVRNLQDIIEAASTDGWCSFEQSLCRLYKDGLITEETAFLNSVQKTRMRKMLDTVKKVSFGDDTNTDGLRLNHAHGERPAAPAPPQPKPAQQEAQPVPPPVPDPALVPGREAVPPPPGAIPATLKLRT